MSMDDGHAVRADHDMRHEVGGSVAFRRFARWLFRTLSRLLLNVQIEGLERIPSHGPLIVMINHINFMDAVLPFGLVPRELFGMTKVELMEKPIFGALLRWYGIFGVQRGEVDRRALRKAVAVLESGRALLLSPEGHRSGHGRLQAAKNGIAFIASRADAPIIPMAIIGGEHFWDNLRRLRRTTVEVKLGQVFHFRIGDHLPRGDMLADMTTQAMYQLARLMPPMYRGEYADVAGASEQYIAFEAAN